VLINASFVRKELTLHIHMYVNIFQTFIIWRKKNTAIALQTNWSIMSGSRLLWCWSKRSTDNYCTTGDVHIYI